MGGHYENGLYNQLMDVMAKLDAIEAERKKDRKEIKTLTTEVASLRKENANLRKKVSVLQTEHAALEEKYKHLENERDLLREEYSEPRQLQYLKPAFHGSKRRKTRQYL